MTNIIEINHSCLTCFVPREEDAVGCIRCVTLDEGLVDQYDYATYCKRCTGSLVVKEGEE